MLDAVLIYYLHEAKIERELSQNFGIMYPSNIDTSGLNPCEPADSIPIYIGANTNCVTRFPLLLLNIDGDQIITLDRNTDGQIVITYLLRNDINDYNLAAITKDSYWINPTVRKEISRHRDHLIVYDASGKKAITIEFVNHNHLSVAGEFYNHKYHISIGMQSIVIDFPDGRKLSLSDDRFFNHQIRVSMEGLYMFTPDPNATSLFVPAHP